MNSNTIAEFTKTCELIAKRLEEAKNKPETKEIIKKLEDELSRCETDLRKTEKNTLTKNYAQLPVTEIKCRICGLIYLSNKSHSCVL